MKSKKGITMITLAITLAVLMILTSIGLTFGTDAIKQTKDNKLVSELQMVQHAVLEQYTKYQAVKDVSLLVGNKMTNQEVELIAQNLGIGLAIIPDTYSNKDYYKLDKASLLELGINNSEDEYIINYVSGEVINITKQTTSDNKVLYVKATNTF